MRSTRSILTLVLTALVALPVLADDQGGKKEAKEEAKRIEQATKTLADAENVLKEAVTAPDRGIPKELLERAECVGVFPGLKKAAFIVGGEFGRGVFTCRKSERAMGPPAFFTMGGPSVGWQFGGEETDIVLLVMNSEGIDHLLKSKFTLGGEASAAAGPVGRTAQAATDLQLHAQVLSWSRSRGLFLGASVEGCVVQQSQETSKAFYGEEVSAEELLLEHKTSMPSEARSFVKTVEEYTRRAS